jgi:molybdopterin molybdotransferase
MITVEEASHVVLRHAMAQQVEIIDLDQAIGRVLAQDICADRDFPPFDRVSMDGIAILFDDWQAGQRVFAVEATVAAGSPQVARQQAGSCFEIMTGAILPKGVDTVIRYEDLSLAGGEAEVLISELQRGQNVHTRALDRRQGDCIIPAGRRISAAELGVAATVGCTRCAVYRLPKAVVISSGDELVPLEAQPLPHQIRMSNSLQVVTLLRSQGVVADRRHWPDDAALIAAELPALLETYELVILSGGVSAGKFDYLPAALEQAGVRKLFHKVQQRPGKPFWFGIHPAGARVFALPGNPVSTFMCTLRYVIPWLRASLGQSDHAQYAILDSDLPFKPDLAYFPPVKLSYQPDGRCIASPVPGHGSGDLANLTDADAFMELPCGKNIYLAGESYRVLSWR